MTEPRLLAARPAVIDIVYTPGRGRGGERLRALAG
jgi:hypothetical protein